MNRSKKSDPKKILVRNTERPVPKTRFIFDEKLEDKVKKKSEDAAKEKTKDKAKLENYQPKFHSPELNSALQIVKKIDKVEKAKPQKVKSVPNIAFNEKVTRKINFPPDQAIYKDLIPLQVPARAPPVLTSREPLPQKDKELVLASFAKAKEVKEFIYEPSIKSDRPQTYPQLNNLRLYKVLQIHQ